jgi:hypothetical protein
VKPEIKHFDSLEREGGGEINEVKHLVEKLVIELLTLRIVRFEVTVCETSLV